MADFRLLRPSFPLRYRATRAAYRRLQKALSGYWLPIRDDDRPTEVHPLINKVVNRTPLITRAIHVRSVMAYRSGIAFLFEDLLPVAIGRPPAATAVIPAGDPCIGSRSKRNAEGHCALLSLQKGAVEIPTLPHPNRRHRTDWGQKRHTYAEFDQPPSTTTTAGRWFRDLLGFAASSAFGISHRFACLSVCPARPSACLTPIKNWFAA